MGSSTEHSTRSQHKLATHTRKMFQQAMGRVKPWNYWKAVVIHMLLAISVVSTIKREFNQTTFSLSPISSSVWRFHMVLIQDRDTGRERVGEIEVDRWRDRERGT